MRARIVPTSPKYSQHAGERLPSANGSTLMMLLAGLLGGLVAATATILIVLSFEGNQNGSSTGGILTRIRSSQTDEETRAQIEKTLFPAQTAMYDARLLGDDPVEEFPRPDAFIAWGVLLTGDGIGVTTDAISQANVKEIIARTSDGDLVPATILVTDPATHLSLFALPGSGYAVANFGSSGPDTVGLSFWIVQQQVLGRQMLFAKSIFMGLSAPPQVTLGAHVSEEPASELVLASVPAAQSGAAIVNDRGDLVGLVREVRDDEMSAISRIAIEEVMRKFLKHQVVTYPQLGVSYLDLGEDQAVPTLLGLAEEHGAYLWSPAGTAVLRGSAGERAGLKDGDIIVAVDGTSITEEYSLARLIRMYAPGDELTLRVRRGGIVQDLNVTLDEREDVD